MPSGRLSNDEHRCARIGQRNESADDYRPDSRRRVKALPYNGRNLQQAARVRARARKGGGRRKPVHHAQELCRAGRFRRGAGLRAKKIQGGSGHYRRLSVNLRAGRNRRVSKPDNKSNTLSFICSGKYGVLFIS